MGARRLLRRAALLVEVREVHGHGLGPFARRESEAVEGGAKLASGEIRRFGCGSARRDPVHAVQQPMRTVVG